MEDILLIGGGGHCKSVIDTIQSLNNFKIVGILEMKEKIGTTVDGVPIIGEDEDMDSYFNKGIKKAFITVGSVGNISLRLKLSKMAKECGFTLPVIIDPSAIVSNTAQIGEGTFVGKGAIINTNVQIGKNCIINTGTIIEHEGVIDDFCHLAPGTVMSGGVHVGHGTHIGTNSTVIQNRKIGSETIIGAGSVVVKDIGSQKKAYGNPCREV